MLNEVVLIGRLVRNPELKHTGTGTAVTTFTMAVDRQFKSQSGGKETDFIDIVTWQKLAETVAANLEKGRLVAVTGRLQIRSYEDKQGAKRKVAEVVADNVRYLDYAKDNSQRATTPGKTRYDEVDFDPDDIPF